MLACTPPVGHQPQQVQAARLARAQAARSASFSKNEPSSTASSMRVRSCLHDRARAQVEVPHLGVAHLALGQADGRAPRRELVCG